MAKIITSPVPRFPGTVVLPDYLTIPQATAWERAQNAASAIDRETATNAEFIGAWAEGITAVVAEWHLERFSAEPFQSTPRVPVVNLIAWLIGEIGKLYEDDGDPN